MKRNSIAQLFAARKDLDCGATAFSDVISPEFFLIQGPLLFNWRRRLRGLPVPRLENGEIGAHYPPTLERFRLWASAHVHVLGRPEWVFVKAHGHGLQDRSLGCLAGEPMRVFLEDLLSETCVRGYQLHFVSAREMANIALAAVEGMAGNPDEYRDYSWRLRES